MGEGAAPCWKEDKGRLAFEDRFQYHEWTFKQAYISSRQLVLSRQFLLQHHSYRLPSCARRYPYVDRGSARMFSLSTLNPYFLILPTAWKNCRPNFYYVQSLTY